MEHAESIELNPIEEPPKIIINGADQTLYYCRLICDTIRHRSADDGNREDIST